MQQTPSIPIQHAKLANILEKLPLFAEKIAKKFLFLPQSLIWFNV